MRRAVSNLGRRARRPSRAGRWMLAGDVSLEMILTCTGGSALGWRALAGRRSMKTRRESHACRGHVAVSGCAFALLGILLGPVRAAAQVSEPLPDLNAIIDQSDRPVEVIRNKSVDPADVAEGCAGGLSGRTLLSFTLATENVGTADLVMGNPG